MSGISPAIRGRRDSPDFDAICKREIQSAVSAAEIPAFVRALIAVPHAPHIVITSKTLLLEVEHSLVDEIHVIPIHADEISNCPERGTWRRRRSTQFVPSAILRENRSMYSVVRPR